MRLDAVEIKVTVAAPQIHQARAAFRLADEHGRHRRVFFCEDLSDRGAGWLPLLDSGVILRLRENKWGDDDSTVKLRPCRRSRLGPDWLDLRDHDGEQFHVEADWSGERKILAAALVANRGKQQIAGLLAGRRPLRKLFTDRQKRFMRECADVAVDLDALSVLGPIDTTRWPPRRIGGFDIAAERWNLVAGGGRNLDLVELSLRVEPAGAEIAQIGFEALIRQHGLDPDATQETKTRIAIELLAPIDAEPPG
jgi:hypothetical protein